MSQTRHLVICKANTTASGNIAGAMHEQHHDPPCLNHTSNMFHTHAAYCRL
jgi:hypothetical protein